MYCHNLPNVVWSFETKHFAVELSFNECDMSLEDTFDYSVDDFEEMRDKIERGELHYFDALVTVFVKPSGVDAMPSHWNQQYHPIAHDSLGACCYEPGEFETGHRDADDDNRNTLAMKARNTVVCHYFPDMVRQAVTQAREVVADYQAINMRVA